MPTTEQVLKLYFYFREVAGRKNRTVPRAEVVNKVAKYAVRYWSMAGFGTCRMCNVTYQERSGKVQKNRSNTTEKGLLDR